MKRITAMLLMTILLLSLSAMSFGDSTLTTTGTKAETTLSYKVTEHFTVTIPSEMSFSNRIAEMTISLGGNVTSDINVTVTSQNYPTYQKLTLLKDDGTNFNYLNYTLYLGNSTFSDTNNSFTLSLANNPSETIKAEITDDIIFSNASQGIYADVLTFTIG